MDLSKFKLRSIFILVLLPIVTVATVIWYLAEFGISKEVVALSIFYYFASGMSVTGGYHRLFSHRTYEASLPVKLLYLFFGAGAFQDSALIWCTDHRYHHNYTDTDMDPYNAKRGFWFSHMGWMLSKKTPVEEKKGRLLTRDLRKDPWVMFQDKHYTVIAVFSGFIMPALIGWTFGKAFEAFLFAGVFRMVMVHQYTFFINSLAHIWGKQTYGTKYTAKDNGLISFFTYGEGYHNFHHHFQNDFRNGVRWYCYDPTKWFIQFLYKLGLVSNLRTTDEHEILLAKVREDSRVRNLPKIKVFEPLEEKFRQIQSRMQNSAEKVKFIQAEYNQLAQVLRSKKDHRLELMKLEIQAMQKEIRMSYRQWKKLSSLALRIQLQTA